MIQAAAEGAIDFRNADVLDRRWWKKVIWILDHLSRQSRAQLNQMQFEQHLAVMDYRLQSFDHHWEQAALSLNKMTALLRPWTDTGPQDPAEIAAAMEKQYYEEFGDPNSPEMKAEMDRLLAHWEGKDAA